jgi:hypothetical protein
LLDGRREAVILATSNPQQRCHHRWWTALPAIPATRGCAAYRRLSRHFADHTMNAFRNSTDPIVLGSRGFYVEGREDHLVPAVFENFSMFPNFQWLEQLLASFSIPFEGEITKAAWSYSYSELLPGKGRPHADIVICWRDQGGRAVLVIEAKKPGCGRNGFNTKDYPQIGHYLGYRAMHGIQRRHQALLLDQRDLRCLPAELQDSPKVITWQELIEIQRTGVQRLDVSENIRRLVLARLDAHHSALGLTPNSPEAGDVRADATRYAELQALDAPECIKAWLIGSEVFFAARQSSPAIQPPYGWLADELTMSDYSRQKRQSTAEREQPVWLIEP